MLLIHFALERYAIAHLYPKVVLLQRSHTIMTIFNIAIYIETGQHNFISHNLVINYMK